MKVQDTIKKSRMLLRKILLLTALSFFLLSAGRAQGSAAAAIDQAMKAGDASAVSQYFGASVDITVNNSTSTYSRTQGEQVLRDFFSRNSVRDFDIEHSGNSTSSNSTYTIGILQTSNGRYKIYLFLRQKDNGYLLKEIRIEKYLRCCNANWTTKWFFKATLSCCKHLFSPEDNGFLRRPVLNLFQDDKVAAGREIGANQMSKCYKSDRGRANLVAASSLRPTLAAASPLPMSTIRYHQLGQPLLFAIMVWKTQKKFGLTIKTH